MILNYWHSCKCSDVIKLNANYEKIPLLHHKIEKSGYSPTIIAEDKERKLTLEEMEPATNYLALSGSEHDMLQHIIQIPEQFKLSQLSECCIYNVPINLRKANEEAYTPQLISIGPFHHGREALQSMEKEKQRYFHFFSERLSDDMVTLQSYKLFLERKEEAIRLCYSEKFPCSKEKLVEMILLDAVFIMELFLRISHWESEKSKYEDDYMITRSWLRKSIQRDLLLLENQLPIFVLEKLYKTVVSDNDKKLKHPNFLELAGEYFKIYDPCNSSSDEPKPVLNLTPSSKSLPDLNCDSDKPASKIKFKNWNAPKNPVSEMKLNNSNDPEKGKSEVELKPWNQSKHFTDLIRYFYLPEHLKFDNENSLQNSGVLRTATQLNEAGVTFEKVENKCLLDIKFHKNRYFSWCLCLSCLPKLPHFNIFKARLQLPQLKVDHTTECVLRNLIAFEQCHYPEQPYICNYVSLIDSLIHTKDDVELLVEKEVISHELGSHKELATLVNGLCKFVVVKSTCYRQTIDDLNGHYRNIWNRTMAALRLVYFRDPWRASSTVVGVAVLVFTVFNFCRIVQLVF